MQSGSDSEDIPQISNSLVGLFESLLHVLANSREVTQISRM